MSTLANKSWNETQKKLRSIILKKTKFDEALQLMLRQHQLVHAAEMTGCDVPTFEDQLWSDMTEAAFRKTSDKSIYSIAWHLWHSARIEDITVSFLIADCPQILESENFLSRLSITFEDTGNSMNSKEINKLSSQIPMQELRQYRIAVGKKTQYIMKRLTPELLYKKVSPVAIEAIRSEKAVLPGSEWLLDYWGRKKIAGIVLMPLTRHLMVHINESKRLQ
jgi:hypothetical protein